MKKSNYKSKIRVVNAGISGNHDKMKLSQSSQTMAARAKDQFFGKEVNVYSLNEVLPKSRNIIIKCDCEGEEHKSFHEKVELKSVYKMQIEYHGGVKELVNILKRKGFKVRTKKIALTLTSGEVGWIFAWR